MWRGLLAVVAVTLVFGATAAARVGEQAAAPRTLAEVRGRVDAVAQNGRRVAWIKTGARCGRQVEILTLPGRRPVDSGSRRGTACERRTVAAIALTAGGRVLWQTTSQGNTYIAVDLFTAALGDSQTQLVTPTFFAWNDGDPDSVDPRPLPTAAQRQAILFYARCDMSDLCRHSRPPGIYRLAGRRARRLARVTSPVALAVSGRRFSVVTNSLRCCNFTPAWSHDGARIAWIYHGNLWTVRADGTGDRQLAADVSPPHSSPDEARRPSWSPDDARIVFERTDARGRPGVVYSVNSTGGDLRRLAAGTAPAWSPDGTRIAFVRGQDVFSIDPDGGAETRLTTAARATTGPLSWSPDSTRIAVSRGGDIYSVRADGAGETRLTSSSEGQPAWSPDGTRIAYVDGSTIAVVNADGTGATHLTRASDRTPAWSPDSKSIAFVREGSREAHGPGALWVMNADGSGQRQLIPGSEYAESPQWAPGGSTIVVGDWTDRDRYGEFPLAPGIRLVSPVDGKATRIAPVPHSQVEIHDALSGRLIERFSIGGHARAAALGPDYVGLLVDNPGRRIEIYDLDGRLRTATVVPSSVRSLSSAGSIIVFATGRVIRRLDAKTGAVTTLATAGRMPVGLSIDGRRVVWAENGPGAARIRAVTAP